ncbi:hypothetical protein DERF_004475 [Dermatophagoides farinae]|uniref:Uncharacterized protein n=1 Tax=Dermatophagoides farinae TaxID=6954 RepID=A0A922I4V7_DERFA|nr:hypothetical protein DERF_004475 [Dermatophagoides farinae]
MNKIIINKWPLAIANFLLLLLRFKLENYSIIGNNNDFNNCDNKQKTVIITWIQYIQMFKAIK